MDNIFKIGKINVYKNSVNFGALIIFNLKEKIKIIINIKMFNHRRKGNYHNNKIIIIEKWKIIDCF